MPEKRRELFPRDRVRLQGREGLFQVVAVDTTNRWASVVQLAGKGAPKFVSFTEVVAVEDRVQQPSAIKW